MRGHRLAAIALALVAIGAAPTPAQAPPRPIGVTYVSSTTVYLDAGRAEGLAVGAQLRVVRGGERIAEVEVTYVAEHSASCKPLSVVQEIRKGDLAVPASPPVPPAEQAEEPPTAPRPEPPSPVPAAPSEAQRDDERRRTQASGYLAVGYRALANSAGPSSDESTGRLSLRLRDVAGSAVEVRVRARGRETRRDGYGPAVETTQREDRLYELSLNWAPESSRFALHLGRLGAGPFLALGYLDGLLAQLRLTEHFHAGVFGGTRPDLEELGFDTAGSKYGAFLRYANDGEPGGGYAEVVVGGVSERADTGDVSRDYVTVESRFGSGSRWWVFQRAEIDVNRDWREEVAGSATEVSNAALSLSLRLTDTLRASLSYDQQRNYLTWETRPLPEEVFTRYFNEGARAALDWQSRSGWSASLGGGLERADDIDEPTTSWFLALTHGNAFGLPLLVGGDGSYYTGGTAEGWVANLRVRWAFRRGHDLGLTLGASQAEIGSDLAGGATFEPRANQWARLSGTLQLPAGFYLFGEYELDTGDDFEGDRALLELGYRF